LTLILEIYKNDMLYILTSLVALAVYRVRYE